MSLQPNGPPETENLTEAANRFLSALKKDQVSKGLLNSRGINRLTSDIPKGLDDEKNIREYLTDASLESSTPLQTFGSLWIHTVQRAEKNIPSAGSLDFQLPFESTLFYYCHCVHWKIETNELYRLATDAMSYLLQGLITVSTTEVKNLPVAASYLCDSLTNVACSYWLDPTTFRNRFLPLVMKDEPTVFEVAIRVLVAAELERSKTFTRPLRKTHPENAKLLDQLCDRDAISEQALKACEQSKSASEQQILESALKELYL